MPKNAKGARGKSGRSGAKGSKAAASTGTAPKVVPATRQGGGESATGQAAREQAGELETSKGAERGSQVAAVGHAQPDMLDGAKPAGDQAQPAIFSSNGQIENRTVGSPSGPVPVAAVAKDAAEADELVKQAHDKQLGVINRAPKDRRLDDATLSRIGRAELQAIAQKRGYELPEAGSRATRGAFANAQDKDENLV